MTDETKEQEASTVLGGQNERLVSAANGTMEMFYCCVCDTEKLLPTNIKSCPTCNAELEEL